MRDNLGDTLINIRRFVLFFLFAVLCLCVLSALSENAAAPTDSTTTDSVMTTEPWWPSQWLPWHWPIFESVKPAIELENTTTTVIATTIESRD